MRTGPTWGLWLLLACGVAVTNVACHAAPPAAGAPAPPAAGAPAPPAVAVAQPDGLPTDDPDAAFPALRLDLLFAERPPLRREPRNPFRFGPATEGTGRAQAPIAPASPVGNPGRRASPNAGGTTETAEADALAVNGTLLRLIGLVEPPGSTGRVAVLTDGRSVYHGGVGDAVEGRYRILSIDETSIEVENLIGGERIPLRLSGF